MQPSTKTILLVDDEPHLSTVIKTCLETLKPWQTITVHSGTAALSQAQINPPDAILLDIMMPDMNGEQLLQALRQSAATHSIPVIIFTASSQHQTVNKFLEYEVAGVIPKPFNPLTLAEQIAQLLGWI